MDTPRKLFDDELNLFRDSVHKFFQSEALPHWEKWENQGQVDRDFWRKAGEMGLLCPQVPEAYGGLGLDFRYNCVVDEEQMAAGITGAGFGLHSDVALPYLLHYGSEAQKQDYLPKMVSGDIISAIAMTEPGTGSDLQGIKTTAQLEGNEWILNGAKTFITNGQLADVVIVVAKTDPGAGSKSFSLFLVDANTPGFSKGQNLKKVGMKSQDTSELFFQDVRLPESQLLGERGAGLTYLMSELPQERLSVAVSAVAHGEMVLKHTLEYCSDRKAFGQSINQFQNSQFKLAELDSELTMARVFIDQCIEWHINGQLDAIMAAKAKLLSTDLQCKVADECVQLHGGYGYMWEYPVARAWADSRVQRIYAGTNEIMKLIIGRALTQ